MHVFRALFGAASATAEQVDPAEARRRQQAGALLIDVRERVEWEAGHAPGALLVPLGQLPARLAELPPARELLLVCRGGARSARARRLLLARGYPRVTNVAGGMLAWARAGLPLVR